MSKSSAPVSARLSEVQAAVTCYVRDGPGFTAVLKARYADFQVNEIGLDGKVAKLTDFDVPSPPSDVKCKVEEDEELNLLNKYDLNLLPVEQWDKINAISVSQNREVLQKFEIDATDMSKEMRTDVHNAVKKAFGKKIVGSTITVGEKKLLLFTNHIKGARIDVRQKWNWSGEFVHFILYKENCDTMEAANMVAERLNMRFIKPSFFGYCGTKDRRAKTTQWFSIKKVDPRKIVNSCKYFRNLKVGNFAFKDHHLKLGQLKGNRFRIALRNVVASDDIIEDALKSLSNNGFINYYGLQRFGSRADVPTFAIGRCLLQGDYKEAILLILKPQGPCYKILEKYRNTESATFALSGYKPHKTTIEIKLLQALRSVESNGKTTNYFNALEKLPRNTRLLYIHSYQSWIWNQCISERIRRYGLKCVAGDLVSDNSSIIYEEFKDDCIELDEDDSNNEADNSEDIACDEKKESSQSDDKPKVQVKILTDADIESQTYNIFDVLLPLPGFTIEYPPNMKEFYEELLKKDNLTLELKHKTKTYSLGGTYRHLITKPEDVTWKFLRYTDPYCDLIASDLDELRKKEPITDVSDGLYKALILEFNLPSCTYATMALREILKMDTSCEIQAQNNDYHKVANSQTNDNKMESDDKINNSGTGEKRKADDIIPEAKKSKTEISA